LFDETGKRYLDLFAGIVTVSCGHCHPRVTAAIHDQVDRLQHTTTIYLHPGMPEFAKKLAGKMPKGLDVTYFVNSGSEANDLAIQLARLHTGNHDVIALRNSYHGASPFTNTLTSHSTWKYPVNMSSGIHHAINPDPYRSPFKGTPEEIASQSANDIKELIRFSTPGKVAAFIAEPIQGVGGATHGAKNYLSEAYAIIRANGGVCIADEVQTGFGRTGDHYWGFENFDVVPDIVVMAKGIGNGVPLAAVTTTAEIAKSLTQRVHFNTFGGNPVCMAAGSAVLDVIEEDGLQENSRVVGGKLKAGLQKLAKDHKLIGDVRGMGLMLAVELVRDRATKEPAKAETLQILEEARSMGVLIGKGGIDGSVLRIKPPMCITAADADFALEVLHSAITAAEQNS
jgi:alanine-glyoxylate transaminase/(R)-3-amino-2-methylpropionate-pyruvate transaminase